MVLKKNIMIKAFFLFTFFLLGSCTYEYTDKDKLNIEEVKKIYLNVKSFEVKKDNLDSNKTDSLLLNEINNKVLKNIETWAWKKFSIEGKQDIAYLDLVKINTNLIEKSKNKNSIILIIEQGKEIYNISLNFDLSITDNEGFSKTLKVSSKIDLILLDKYSIIKRNKVIDYNVDKLIKLIDEKINVELNKDSFKKFVIR